VPASAVPGTHWITAVARHSKLTAQAAFTVSTNWSQFQYSVQRRGWNPDENVLNPGNVAGVTQAWSFPTGSDSIITSTPAVARGVVYFGSGNADVYAVNAATGAELLSYTTGGDVFSSPAVVNGMVYVGSTGGNVYALDAATGAKLWSDTTGNEVLSSQVVVNGVVYTTAFNGPIYTLYAFRLPGGPAAPARPSPGSLHPSHSPRQQRQ
jgi:outer membrane protein assembly factor BamB